MERKGVRALVPVDFSPHTEDWVKRALDLFGSYISRLTFMYVLPLGLKELEDFVDPKTIRQAEASAKSKLEALAESFAGQYRISIIVATGDPASLIVDEANSGKYDVVIMGHRGYGYREEFFVGSVTLKVISSSKVPVLVIHRERKLTETGR